MRGGTRAGSRSGLRHPGEFGASERLSMDVESERGSSLLSVQQDMRSAHSYTHVNTMGGDDLVLGSQSTLASDRGAGARLVQASQDPTNYQSSQNVHREVGGHPGSPIWKPRGLRNPQHSPEDGEGGGGGAAAGGEAVGGRGGDGRQQRVTFRVPPSAYMDGDDVDC